MEATYDVLHDESEIEHVRRGCAQVPCGGEGQGGQGGGEQDEDDELELTQGRKRSDGAVEVPGDLELRGLAVLRVVTDRGTLKLEE